MKPVQWGVLGTAGIARKAMLPALLAAPNCQVGAIASRDLARAEAMAVSVTGQPRPRAYGSYDALLADPTIEAVYIPLPNHLHVQMSLAALAAGKHVLCEKPLALSTADAARLQAAARAARAGTGTGTGGGQPRLLLLREAFMTRHHPQWIAARAAIEAGEIGQLHAVQALFSYSNRDPANVRNQLGIGGGGLYDIGCYAIDTARFFFQSEPLRAVCMMQRDPEFGTDRLSSGLLEFATGQLSFTVATQSALAQGLTLLGSAGYLVLEAPFNCPPSHPPRLALDPGQDLLGGGRRWISPGAADAYARQAESFAAAIRSGHDPFPGPQEACANAAALEALTRSAQSGRFEEIPQYLSDHAGD